MIRAKSSEVYAIRAFERVKRDKARTPVMHRFAKREALTAKHLRQNGEKAMEIKRADVAELVDARDLKSLDGNVVWVRLPPPAPMFCMPAVTRAAHDQSTTGNHVINLHFAAAKPLARPECPAFG